MEDEDDDAVALMDDMEDEYPSDYDLSSKQKKTTSSKSKSLLNKKKASTRERAATADLGE